MDLHLLLNFSGKFLPQDTGLLGAGVTMEESTLFSSSRGQYTVVSISLVPQPFLS